MIYSYSAFLTYLRYTNTVYLLSNQDISDMHAAMRAIGVS